MIAQSSEYSAALTDYVQAQSVKALLNYGATPEEVGALEEIAIAFQQEVARYVWFGIEPGRLVRSALRNDLKDIMANATSRSLPSIQTLVVYLTKNLPTRALGSEHAIKAWVEQGGIVGLQMRARA